MFIVFGNFLWPFFTVIIFQAFCRTLFILIFGMPRPPQTLSFANISQSSTTRVQPVTHGMHLGLHWGRKCHNDFHEKRSFLGCGFHRRKGEVGRAGFVPPCFVQKHHRRIQFWPKGRFEFNLSQPRI